MLRLLGRIKRQENVPCGLTEQIATPKHLSPPLPRKDNFPSELPKVFRINSIGFWMRCQPTSQFVELLLKRVQSGKGWLRQKSSPASRVMRFGVLVAKLRRNPSPLPKGGISNRKTDDNKAAPKGRWRNRGGRSWDEQVGAPSRTHPVDSTADHSLLKRKLLFCNRN